MARTLIKIPEEVADIAPGYLENRIRDLSTLKDALARKDFDAIARLAHKTKGTAGGYGFAGLSVLAKSLETAAKSENLAESSEVLERMRIYLEEVEIEK
jgi:HPt (histidine-containing phosphotransfer) domain-containing protein